MDQDRRKRLTTAETPAQYLLNLHTRRFVVRTPLSGGFRAFKEAFASETGEVFARRLAFCPAEDCGNPFIIYRGRKYCSQRCADRQRLRKFRTEHPHYSRDQYRKKAHPGTVFPSPGPKGK